MRSVAATRTIASGVALLAVLGAACEREGRAGTSTASDTSVLTPSAAWAQTAGTETSRERLADLTAAIEQLRAATSSGWVGRQDDDTGYLAELRGGRFTATAATTPADHAIGLLDEHGERLFGVTGREIEFGDASADAAGIAVLRGTQRVGDVPVVDGALSVTVVDASADPHVTAVQGHVFPGLAVDTSAQIPIRRARRVAARETGGSVQGRPRLVVLPAGTGSLAWEVEVVGIEGQDAGGATVYVDAVSARVLDVRVESVGPVPGAVADAAAIRALAAGAAQGGGPGSAVEVTGAGPRGETLTGSGRTRGDGTVELVDETVATFDRATGEGVVRTRDASGLIEGQEGGLPDAPVVSSDDARIDDPDAIAAHVYSRVVMDYYLDVQGRVSWDGLGGSLDSAVHFGAPEYCNAGFYGGLRMMVYGKPCIRLGEQATGSQVDIDTAAHEVTHGVTSTTANLLYTGQSGAMNESFSDYFGNAIGNRFKGVDDAALFEDNCAGLPAPTVYCRPVPDGRLAMRYLLNGATFADYLYVVDPPDAFGYLDVFMSQDHGGVHLNSAIFNHALWSIRHRLAQMDATTGNVSPRAAEFDRVVYHALTEYLGPTSDFLDGRAAVESATQTYAQDPAILEVVREQFDRSLICSGCAAPTAQPVVPVSLDGATSRSPAVSGDQLLWVDFNGSESFGVPQQAIVGGHPEAVPGAQSVSSAAFAGDAVVTSEGGFFGESVWFYGDDVQAVGVIDLDPAVGGPRTGVAGSEQGAAWVEQGEGRLGFVDAEGGGVFGPLPADVAGETVTAVGTGGGTVVAGTMDGAVIVWTPGSDPALLTRVADHAILAIAAHGDRVLAIAFPQTAIGRANVRAGDTFLPAGRAILYDVTTGGAMHLSDGAAAFGAALSADHAVWGEQVGVLGGAVAGTFTEETEKAIPDTDLYLYSSATDTVYDLLPQRGQQAFPVISGRRLVWVDTVNGGNDVYTATLPEGL